MSYDAGLLNDHGGGNVGWWHDYIRAELERSREYYESENAALRSKLEAVTRELARELGERAVGRDKMGNWTAIDIITRAEKAEAEVTRLTKERDGLVGVNIINRALDKELGNRTHELAKAESDLAALRVKYDGAMACGCPAALNAEAKVTRLTKERDEARDSFQQAVRGASAADLVITRLTAEVERMRGALERIVVEHGSLGCHIYEGLHAQRCAACIAREALTPSPAKPSAESKEEFYCCKDQDNPCHPIRDYCSTGRSRMEPAKPETEKLWCKVPGCEDAEAHGHPEHCAVCDPGPCVHFNFKQGGGK